MNTVVSSEERIIGCLQRLAQMTRNIPLYDVCKTIINHVKENGCDHERSIDYAKVVWNFLLTQKNNSAHEFRLIAEEFADDMFGPWDNFT